MIHRTLKFSAALVSLSLVAGVALTQPSTSVASAHRRAPAPLLAAGVPAFLALGGGALVGRVMRRRKTATQKGNRGDKHTADTEA